MKEIQPSERKFQTWVKKNWHSFVSQLHPGIGSDFGIPDLLVLTPGGLIPTELKIGTVDDNTLWCSEIRPAQIGWHTRLANAGGTSIFLVGVWSGDHWQPYALDGALASQWETTGFEIGVDAFPLNPEDLETSLSDYLFEKLDV